MRARVFAVPTAVAARYGARPVAATAFYWRRVLRILPAYWLALTALAVYPGLARFSDRWWQLYSLTQVYDPRTTFAGIGPAWSLCIEASFYLLLPLYALAASRLYCARRGPRREAAVLASLALGSIAFHVLIGRTGENSLLAYTLPGTFYLFALGMALALISVVGNRVERVVRERGALCWLAAGGTYLVVATSTDAESLGSVHPVYGVVATLLVLPAVFPSEKLAGRTLAIPGLAWLGVISYGVYLWHQEMLIEIHRLIPAPLPLAAVALGGTVAIAATSYYLLELPFLRLKRRSPWSRPAMHDRDGWAGSPYAGPPVPHSYGPPENEHGLA